MIYVLRVLTGKEEEVWLEFKKRSYQGYVPSQEIPQRRGGEKKLLISGYSPSRRMLRPEKKRTAHGRLTWKNWRLMLIRCCTGREQFGCGCRFEEKKLPLSCPAGS